MKQKEKIGWLIQQDYDEILNVVSKVSNSVEKYMKTHNTSQYILYKKYISQADLITVGKCCKSEKEKSKDIKKTYFNDYLLYYLNNKELKGLEKEEKLPCTKQSNIAVPDSFIMELGAKVIKRRKGHQKKEHKHIKLNDYADIYFANDTLKYFNEEYSKNILKKLGKNNKFNSKDYSYNMTEGAFSNFTISYTVLGIGLKDDVDFFALRHSIFWRDALYILLEKNRGKRRVFIMLEKNPKFFSILNETNTLFEEYLIREQSEIDTKLGIKKRLLDNEEEKTRNGQGKWRNCLADEAMNYTTHDNEVFCLFTNLKTSYKDLGTVFRASHIKRYEDCTPEEAYNINNGILLSANADALFDKHYITVSEDKKLVFSFLLKNDPDLMRDLDFVNKLNDVLLNDERMKFLKIHRNIFYEKEEERKKGKISID